MKTTTHPRSFSIGKNFPKARRVRVWEGGCAYLAERDGVPYIIIDESTLADFIALLGGDDQDLLDQLVKVIAFESDDERSEYMRTRWPDNETGGDG